eukprot:2869979-Rhodomonas_salina.2
MNSLRKNLFGNYNARSKEFIAALERLGLHRFPRPDALRISLDVVCVSVVVDGRASAHMCVCVCAHVLQCVCLCACLSVSLSLCLSLALCH